MQKLAFCNISPFDVYGHILGKCSAMKTCSQGQNIETLNSGSVIKDLENSLLKNALNFKGNDLYPPFADLNPPS